MARYEEPVRDSLGFVLFNGDSVLLESAAFTVKSLEYSKDGVPNKVVLSDNRTVNALDLIKHVGP
jgi:hypothetical protein